MLIFKLPILSTLIFQVLLALIITKYHLEFNVEALHNFCIWCTKLFQTTRQHLFQHQYHKLQKLESKFLIYFQAQEMVMAILLKSL